MALLRGYFFPQKEVMLCVKNQKCYSDLKCSQRKLKIKIEIYETIGHLEQGGHQEGLQDVLQEHNEQRGEQETLG
jgi:hypothetical protein